MNTIGNRHFGFFDENAIVRFERLAAIGKSGTQIRTYKYKKDEVLFHVSF